MAEHGTDTTPGRRGILYFPIRTGNLPLSRASLQSSTTDNKCAIPRRPPPETKSLSERFEGERIGQHPLFFPAAFDRFSSSAERACGALDALTLVERPAHVYSFRNETKRATDDQSIELLPLSASVDEPRAGGDSGDLAGFSVTTFKVNVGRALLSDAAVGR